MNNKDDMVALALLMAARAHRARLNKPLRNEPKVVVKKATRLSGDLRNKPCPCGSGIKAKKCSCDDYR